MSQQLEFQFEGQDACANAEQLQEFLKQDFADWTAQIEQKTAESEVKSFELAIAIAALIISLPSAINETVTLVERIKLKKKADSLIDWGKDRAQRGVAVPKIVLENGRTVPLDKALPDEIINAMSAKW